MRLFNDSHYFPKRKNKRDFPILKNEITLLLDETFFHLINMMLEKADTTTYEKPFGRVINFPVVLFEEPMCYEIPYHICAFVSLFLYELYFASFYNLKVTILNEITNTQWLNSSVIK